MAVAEAMRRRLGRGNQIALVKEPVYFLKASGPTSRMSPPPFVAGPFPRARRGTSYCCVLIPLLVFAVILWPHPNGGGEGGVL